MYIWDDTFDHNSRHNYIIYYSSSRRSGSLCNGWRKITLRLDSSWHTCRMVGLNCGLGFTHDKASRMIVTTSSTTSWVGMGRRVSNISFHSWSRILGGNHDIDDDGDNDFDVGGDDDDEDDCDMDGAWLNIRSPGWLPMISSSVNMPKL